MPKQKITSKTGELYSSDFKLKVVLEYIRNPKRQKRICKTNRISDGLLTKWHQEFIAHAGEIFASPAVPDQKTEPSSTKIELANKLPSDSHDAQVSHTWGVKLNNKWNQSFQSPSTSREPPTWLNPAELKDWRDERGVIVWDEGTKKLDRLLPGEALELLEKLRKTDAWQAEGIAIIHRVRHRITPKEPKRIRSRPKEMQEEPDAEKSKPVYEEVLVERLRLPPTAGTEFVAFLQAHEDLLKQMAAEDEKRINAAFRLYYSSLFRQAHEREEKEIDLATRSLPWTHHAESHTWVCDTPPNRGTVFLSKDVIEDFAWQGCIERPDEFKRLSPYFIKLSEALTWTEQELLSIQNSQTESEQKTDQGTSETPPKAKIDLTPYRIAPSVLEPERITYRVLIEVNYMPDSFETMELSFGKVRRYAEKFPSVARVARELHLDQSQATIEKRTGAYSGRYPIFSTATYYQEFVASAQAQQLWDHCQIQELYNERKIRGARYGFEEVETGYCIWLGGVEDPEQPLPKPQTRAEHMAEWALGITLEHALDVDGYREYLNLSTTLFSDEKVLEILHARRTRSKFAPASARAESEEWLRRHAKEK